MKEKRKKSDNVPNLRFPGFEDEWQTHKLGKIIDFKVTNSFSRDNLNYENGTVKNIHYGDIHTKFQTLFDITKERVPYINEDISINKISEDFYCKEGDIVFADASEDLNDVGKSIEIVNLNNEKLLTGLHTLLARPKENYFYNGFNGYLFKSNNIKLQIQKESQGTKVLSISAKRISTINICFPTIQEQIKITKLLTLIDFRIYTQNEIIQRYESLMKGLSQKLFTQKLKFEDKKSVKDRIWDNRKLGTLTFKVGKKNKENLSYPIYSINNKEGFLPQNQQFEGMDSNDRGYDISLYKIIKSKTFAYNPARINVGSIGFSGELNDIIISSLYVCFKTNKELEDNYLLHYLDSYHFNKSVLRNVEGGVRQYLFYENFSSIKIPLPSKDEQTKIANFLDSYKEKITIEKNLLESLKSQKKYFLQQLFI